MADNSSVFAKYVEDDSKKEQLEPEPDIVRKGPQALLPLTHRNSAPSEILLSWIINFWPKNVITLRDITAYAPRSVRDPKDALHLTGVLTQFGWLAPVQAWRRDQKKWRVIRGPSKEAAQ
jgi:hypothetical protein